MKTYAKYAVSFLSLTFCGCGADLPCVHVIGDSTVADYDANTTQTCGWGQMLGQMTPDGVTVVNHAKPGRSSCGFYTDGSWKSARKEINPGDIVLIQFGHNDERMTPGNADTPHPSSPWDTYCHYLSLFVDETRQAGATPVVVTPTARRLFDGNTVSLRGLHNFGKTARDTTLDFAAAAKHVADSTEANSIDLCAKSKQIIEAYGIVGSKEQLYVRGDNTHTSAKGAAVFAMAVAEALDTMGLCDKEMRHPAIIVSRQAIDFGDVFVGDTAREALDIVDLFGVSTLQPKFLTHHKTISIEATSGFKLARDANSALQDTLNIYTNSTASVFVCYAPKSNVTEASKLKISTPDATVSIMVEGRGRVASRHKTSQIAWADVAKPLETTTMAARLASARGLELTGNGGFLPMRGAWTAEPDYGSYIQLRINNGENTLRIGKMSISSSSEHTYKTLCSLGTDFFRSKDIGQRGIDETEPHGFFKTDTFYTGIVLKPYETLYVRLYIGSSITLPATPFIVSNMTFDVDTIE